MHMSRRHCQQATATKPPSARRASVAAVRKFGISGTLGRGVDIPQSFIAGTYATAGSLVWGEEWGSSNEYLTQVIEVSNLPVRGLAGIFIDGEEVTIESTQVHTDFGNRLGSNTSGSKNYNGYAWVKFYDGNQTSADPVAGQ